MIRRKRIEKTIKGNQSGRGGARSGAGRPKGSKGAATQKRAEIAKAALEKGVTPLEVMLRAMNEALEREDIVAAHGFAKDAAPYVHPKLMAQSLEHGGSIKLESVSKKQRDATFRAALRADT